jgi:5-formyltetrahydrofolate cyclo-ligase
MTQHSAGPAMAAAKMALRRAGRQARLAASTSQPNAPSQAAAQALRTLDLAPRAIVSGYMAMPGELDPAPLLAALVRHGHRVALPVVLARDAALAFRAWHPGLAMEPGVLGIPVPPASSPLVVPDVLLVPLIAFDALGRRLGQGGGFYDRTLAQRRAKGPAVVALGLAFAVQEVPEVPEEAFDERLDGIITEAGLRWFGKEQVG